MTRAEFIGMKGLEADECEWCDLTRWDCVIDLGDTIWLLCERCFYVWSRQREAS